MFGLGISVFVANAFVTVFPGLYSTSTLLLATTLPLVALLVVAAVGLPQLTGERGLGMLAVTLGPLAAMGFALTGGRTQDYQALLTRSSTFMHLGIVVAAAVALALLVQRRPTVGRIVTGVVVVAILMSALFPFVGFEAIGYEFVSQEDEFEAAMFATEYVGSGWAADDHIANIAAKYRSANATAVPTTAWLRGTDPPPTCPTVARETWTTVGAPDLPEPVSISKMPYERWVMTGDVVYAGGVDTRTIVRWGPSRCEGPPPHGAPQ
jgi:hypothetical protein